MSYGKLHERFPCLVCNHVFLGKRPVLLVVNDRRWMFLCGHDDHADHHAEYKIVGFGHLLNSDPSLEDVVDLASGHEAARNATTGRWRRKRIVGE